METYKKPVVASKYAKNLLPSVVIFPLSIVARKVAGGDDLHKEDSLTTRKNFTE